MGGMVKACSTCILNEKIMINSAIRGFEDFRSFDIGFYLTKVYLNQKHFILWPQT